MVLAQVQKTIARHAMLARGDRVVAAVSGGMDSMVLLHLLSRLREVWDLQLWAAHLHHGIRGEEADRDAACVREWAGRLQVGAIVERVDVPRLLRTGGRGHSMQEVAREIRYRFLEAVADRVGASRIALGHHRDDQAETVLLNLLRGAGPRGLGGIPPVRERIIRPLIEVERAEIEGYAKAHDIPSVVDSSNTTDHYLRNRVRHHLLPLLAAEFNPRIARALATAADTVREEDDYLDARAREALAACRLPGSPMVLSLSLLRALPLALRRRGLREAIAAVKGDLRECGLTHLRAVEELLAGEEGRGEVHLPGRVRLVRERERVRVEVRGCEEPGASAPLFSPVPVPDLQRGDVTVSAMGLRFRFRLLPPVFPPEDVSAWCALLDGGQGRSPLTIRPWRPGDRFVPLGMRGTKKLQDFFTDAKVPREERSRVPLLVSGERILWVVGHRVDDRARLRPASRTLLRVDASRVGTVTP